MKIRAKRDVLPQRKNKIKKYMCAPPSYKYQDKSYCYHGRMSLFVLRGNLTVEASMVLPFFLMVLFTFFSLFSQYASAAQMKVLAAAEAKKIGIVTSSLSEEKSGDITIYKSTKLENMEMNPFPLNTRVTESATCRAWIGFTGVEDDELYVYITPHGSVYHLSANCTHLELSIQWVSKNRALEIRNQYGERYRECDLCKAAFGAMVYITDEGNCYHSERSCSGLKRSVRRVPKSQVSDRPVCQRCVEREGM